MVVNRITTMGARSGGGGGGRNGAKGSITYFTKNPKSQQLGDLAGRPYTVGYKQNGKKGESYANFQTKAGADMFQKAVKAGNGVQWSLQVANKVDWNKKMTLTQSQMNQAARRKLSQMIHSGALKSQYPNGVPVGGTVTVTL